MHYRIIHLCFALITLDPITCVYPTCQSERLRLGNEEIALDFDTMVMGRKIQFSTMCNLRDVDEYRGLRYGVIKPSDKVFRFMRNKDLVRSTERKFFATIYKPVCSQYKFLNEELANMPDLVKERIKLISQFTTNQSEDCLWLNVYVPGKVRSLPVLLWRCNVNKDYAITNGVLLIDV
ncbi:hypothetical protein DPMN_141921 [Dreissena polymorpha]|uniref:Carboxylesterase type B domain-containing protein n=1 Tax=Dreissena polymorpha TaxID=45954 RepID=A0A9D4GAW4_DREPO|nr:hypothetical protein DPMN_141921 [Dreissena polymorpha]